MRSSRPSLYTDLRLPLVLCTAEGLILLGLLALFSYLHLPRLPLIAGAMLLLYLLSAGAIMISSILR